MSETTRNVGAKVAGVRYSNSHLLSSKERMEAFDCLPIELRHRISSSPFCIDAISVHRCLKAGFSVKQVMHKITDCERQFYANAYADRGVSQ